MNNGIKTFSKLLILIMFILAAVSYFLGNYKSAIYIACLLFEFTLICILTILYWIHENINIGIQILIRREIKENKKEIKELEKQTEEIAKNIEKVQTEQKRRPGRPRKVQ